MPFGGQTKGSGSTGGCLSLFNNCFVFCVRREEKQQTQVYGRIPDGIGAFGRLDVLYFLCFAQCSISLLGV